MTATLLDFSLKADLQATGELVASVSDVAERLDIHCFITGALARDLWIVHHMGIQVARQTNDVDFAIAVASWEQFHAFRKALVDSGKYRDTAGAPLHRLRHRNGIPIDLVPFGGVERAETRSIAWPPDNACKDMALLLDSSGRERLARVISEEADKEGQLQLAGEMMRDNPEQAVELLAALEDGFIGERHEQ